MTIKLPLLSILMIFGPFGIVSCSDVNQHQFKLNYEHSAHLTLTCGNCYNYFKNYDTPSDTIVIDQEIDATALELLANIKFCGVGDTTPDAWLKIVSDTGSETQFGILYPNDEYDTPLEIQSRYTGKGRGCKKRDQLAFESFFHTYLNKIN